MRMIIILVCVALAAPAIAQQQPDVDVLQKAVSVLQAQRNGMLDALTIMETRAALLADENAKLKAEIEQLKQEQAARSGEPKAN